MATSPFSANASMQGYVYQALYALYAILCRSEDFFVYFERFDDIEFEGGEDVLEQLQLKHHTKPGSLSDTSVDLWKTLRVWCENYRQNLYTSQETILILITTSEADKSSIASKMRTFENRNDKEIVRSLTETAKSSKSQELTDCFKSFLNLNEEERVKVISFIQIIDKAMLVSDIDKEIKGKLINGVERKYRDPVYDRLIGWWFQKIIFLLTESSPQGVSGRDVRDQIAHINSQFAPESLPIDYLSKVPSEIDPQSDTRIFVDQLRAISLDFRYIEKAIIDYYKAFEQRSRWIREEILYVEELQEYESRLIDEWERFYMYCREILKCDLNNEDSLQALGKKVFLELDQKPFPIRPQVSAPYVARGSFHMLADKNPPGVYWHPEFVKRLCKVVTK